MPVFPLTNFLLYDDHVLIESLTAQQRLDSPDDIQAYEDFFQQLRDAALTNHDLEALVLRITTEHRQDAGFTPGL